MKNSDEAIDRVLAGLRESVAPEGLELRVLAAVHQRAAAPRVGFLRWSVVGGLAVAAAAVVVLLAVPRHAAVPAAIRAVVQPQPMPMPAAMPGPAAARPRRHTPAVRANAEVPAANVPAANSRAASFPAPPMPLTEQERLLLEIARRGEPKAAPVLDPDALARQETRSEQVFQTVLAAAQQPSIFNHKEDTQ
jgi:hypothetical protein